MNTVFICANIENIDKILDNFSKSKGDNRKIIASESQYRNTDQNTEHACHCRADQYRQNKSRNRRKSVCCQMRKESAGICAHAHKACMAQTQLAGKSNYKVQRNGCDRINAQRNQKTCQKSGKISCGGKNLDYRKQNDHNSISYKITSCCLIHIFFHIGHLTLSPECFYQTVR